MLQPPGKVFVELNAAGAHSVPWEVAKGLHRCQTSWDMLGTKLWHFVFVLLEVGP